MRHYLSRYPLGCLLSLFFSLSFSQVIAQEQTVLPVNVLGHTYEALLQENTALGEKLHGIANSRQTKHYSGSLRGIEDSWVRVSMVQGQWQGVVSLYGSVHIIEQEENTQSNGSSGRSDFSLGMQSTPVDELGEELGSCGPSGHSMHSKAASSSILQAMVGGSSGGTTAAATVAQLCAQAVDGVCIIAELEFAFDTQFQAQFPGVASDQAIAMINIVEGYYLSDMKMAFDSITVELLSNELFDTTTNASLLLDDIDSKKANGQIPFIKNNRALFHLVTGRDFDGSTAGIAYVNSVCAAGGFGTGTSSVVGSGNNRIPLTALVVAHELGHNFGSDHDGSSASAACAPGIHIMSPSLSAAFTNFSSCSVDSMEASISGLMNQAMCFDYPADLSLTASVGNPTAGTAGQAFTSAYSVGLVNGFQAVDLLRVDGSMDTNEGEFIAVTANGAACTVAPGGGSYQCDVNNPGATTSLNVQTRPSGNTATMSITQSASEQTADVQDIDTSDNSLITQFSVSGATPPPASPPPAAPPSTPSAIPAAESSGGGGGGSTAPWLLLSLMLVAVSSRRLVWPRLGSSI